MGKKLIVDAFLGFNEIELAQFRISYLKDFVDVVVIAESRLSHSGMEKPLFFNEWKRNSHLALETNLVILEVPLNNQMSSWEREIFSREFLANYLLREYPKDFFILSDLDEIPSRDQVKKLRNSDGIFHFRTPTTYRRANWFLLDSHCKWNRGVMGEVSYLKAFSNGARFSKLREIGGEPGIHLSYLLHDSQKAYEKIQSFAHVELNSNVWNSKYLFQYCDKYRIDHLGRSRNRGFGLFKIGLVTEDSILHILSTRIPGVIDTGLTVPNYFMRILASVWLTSYIGGGPFSKIKRKMFSPSTYFRLPLLYFLIPPVLELMITFLYAFRRCHKFPPTHK